MTELMTQEAHREVASRTEAPGTVACAAVTVIALTVLFLGVALTKTPALYDEPWYLSSVGVLHQYGLTRAFIQHFPGPAGPLYTLVQAAFEPITHLQVPGVRLVNFVLLLATIAATAAALHLRRARTPIISALALIGLPTTWVAGGMALTEMPAAFFLVSSVVLLLLAIRSERPLLGVLSAIGGGLCLSLAIAGRQPIAVALFAVPVLAIVSRRSIARLTLYAAFALIVPVYLFHVWGGMVPPQMAWVGRGISIPHGLLSFAYLAVLMALIAPSWFRMRPMWIVLGTIPMFIANAAFRIIRVTPGWTFAGRVLSPHALTLYTWTVSSVIASAGVLGLIAMLKRMWEDRRDAEFVCLTTMLLVLAAANAGVVHLFSSRYIAAYAPLLLLVGDRHSEATWGKAARLAVGAAFGCASLATYLKWV